MSFRQLVVVVVLLSVFFGLSGHEVQADSSGWWVEVTSDLPLKIRQCPSINCLLADPSRRAQNWGPGTAMVTAIPKGDQVKVYGFADARDHESCVDPSNCVWDRVDGGYIYSGYTKDVQDPPDIQYTCPGGGRCIVIDRVLQRLYAVEGSEVKLATFTSTGGWNPTPAGTFRVLEKISVRTMVGTPATTGKTYGLYDVPWQVRFYGLYKIHGSYWHNSYGLQRKSSGCVNLVSGDAKFVFNFVSIGTPIIIGDAFEYDE